jgi:transcriptional regulator with XRE-family HTH domain
MKHVEIGQLVRARRDALGLSRERLARLSGLSRATIARLENGTLANPDASKLGELDDLLGLQLKAIPRRTTRRHALRMASRMASVSYQTSIGSDHLAQALATGELPTVFIAHVSTFLDEAPLSLIVSAVEEAAQSRGVRPRRIWQHLIRWAQELRSPRPAWA